MTPGGHAVVAKAVTSALKAPGAPFHTLCSAAPDKRL